MVSLAKQIAAEKENVEKTLNNLEDVKQSKNKSIVELAAIATFLHNIYNGIENILKRILKTKNVEIAKSETWHKDLLKVSVSGGIISKKLFDELYEYLTFRHFFVHAYGFMLDDEQLEDLAGNIADVWHQFLAAIKEYC